MLPIVRSRIIRDSAGTTLANTTLELRQEGTGVILGFIMKKSAVGIEMTGLSIVRGKLGKLDISTCIKSNFLHP